MKLPELMTVAEFAKYAKVCEVTVRRNCQSGKLPAIKVGHSWRIITEKALNAGHQ